MITLEERAERNRAKTETAEEELRSLSTRLMHAQEDERRTISRELHDEVGQVLTGLRMGIGGLEGLRQSQERFHEKVGEIRSLAEQAFRSVREIAAGLRPSVLDLGLVPAIEWQARQFAKYSGVRAGVHAEGEVGDIPDEYRTCIYRVVQECLTNALKHAGASSVRIEIREAKGALRVAVHDDGKGFQGRNNMRSGLGLIGMEERVRELGGSLQVDSSPAAGTSVLVLLNLPKT
jgi:signal transduction histidine kinase